MKFKLQMVAVEADGKENNVQEITLLEKDFQSIEELGMSLAESKEILRGIQNLLLSQQVAAYLRERVCCQSCGSILGTKGRRNITFRTLFGNYEIVSPRLYQCQCQAHEKESFSPLSSLLPEHVSPEMRFMETRWSSLVSYGMTLKALKDFLPIDEKLSIASIRNHTLKVAAQCEKQLGEEPTGFISNGEGETTSQSQTPILIGVDGGYIRHWEDKKKKFEVIVGKSVAANGDAKCFGLVQTFDTKPKLRVMEHLQAQGIKHVNEICFICDGEKVLRQLRLSLSAQAQHILDWFHITMKITVLGQFIKGIAHLDKGLADDMQQALALTKWNLWHGKVTKALDRYLDFEILLYQLNDDYCYLKFDQMEKAVYDFKHYIEGNQESLCNYGENWRKGKIISSAFVESLVNQLISKRFAKKQQMQWTPKGAHLLLQMRVKTLNGDLSAAFIKWYPSIALQEHNLAA